MKKLNSWGGCTGQSCRPRMVGPVLKFAEEQIQHHVRLAFLNFCLNFSIYNKIWSQGVRNSFFDKQLQLFCIIKKLGKKSKNENGHGVEFDFLKLLIPFLTTFVKKFDLRIRPEIFLFFFPSFFQLWSDQKRIKIFINKNFHLKLGMVSLIYNKTNSFTLTQLTGYALES